VSKFVRLGEANTPARTDRVVVEKRPTVVIAEIGEAPIKAGNRSFAGSPHTGSLTPKLCTHDSCSPAPYFLTVLVLVPSRHSPPFIVAVGSNGATNGLSRSLPQREACVQNIPSSGRRRATTCGVLTVCLAAPFPSSDCPRSDDALPRGGS
jgi:hypothetical protein